MQNVRIGGVLQWKKLDGIRGKFGVLIVVINKKIEMRILSEKVSKNIELCASNSPALRQFSAGPQRNIRDILEKSPKGP